MTTILTTTALGDIRGKTEDGVTQFQGIKYATLKNRFADAELIEERYDGVLDATTDGPTAVSLPIGCDIELGHIQHALPKKDLTQSDLHCLNLNIAVPANANPSSKLPVFVFIHGGGLFIGANSWPQYNMARLVRLSIEKDLPVVAVAINYRLGALGFLTSEELRNAGHKANNGLRDQRVALGWVQKHIHNFGGDPENVTAAGMSAGGASVTYHLQSRTPLFKRAIAMSGTSLLSQAFSYDAHEENYNKAMVALGLTEVSAHMRVQVLINMEGHELVSKLPPSILTAPAIDSDLVQGGVTYFELGKPNSKILAGNEWCRELLIGDAEMDSSIFEYLTPQMKNNCAKNFIAATHKVLLSYPEEAQHLLDAYGLTENTPDEQALSSVLAFISDALFHAAALSFARGWNGNAYVYHFNEGNPWPGPYKGRPSHILDTAYLFQNFREYLDPDQQTISTAFAEDVFKFCHGIAPWPSIRPGDLANGFSARVYGPSEQGKTVGLIDEAFGKDSMRSGALFDLASSVSLDELAKIAIAFLSS